jgi:hypothetical protein
VTQLCTNRHIRSQTGQHGAHGCSMIIARHRYSVCGCTHPHYALLMAQTLLRKRSAQEQQHHCDILCPAWRHKQLMNRELWDKSSQNDFVCYDKRGLDCAEAGGSRRISSVRIELTVNARFISAKRWRIKGVTLHLLASSHDNLLLDDSPHSLLQRTVRSRTELSLDTK